MRYYRGTAVACVVIVAMLGFLVWRSERGPTFKSPPPPGFQSPANAVAGFMDNLMRHRVQAACQYGLPGDQGLCEIGAETMFLLGGKVTGSWTVGHVVTAGNRAIVDVEIDACLGSDCVTNMNPDSGLPASGTSFSSAFARALTSSDNATDCKRLRGGWYVDNISPSAG